ncbi:helix-turn-helix transcriptional regulator [Micromonospora sp. HM134]|uniref:helix-turn-helix domain-containing protein n=1 Tax=Micromonospora sp. HM134 TaxID=2583243 RepID=UPI0011987B20|nr:helix-turn-helix transcriptional regulator [Micromonospora sp. HM134]QDY06117.1 helix-turn-helix transcriptional regulator [Micromonospora sp. HM134]
MAPPIEARKARFGQWVKRVVDHAKATRGLSVPKIADLAGIGNQTIYRWINAAGEKLPDPENVRAFCDAVGVPTTEPFQILWPGRTDTPTPAQPLSVLDDDFQLLQRRLNDPNTSEFEREFIRETIRQLADRPSQRPGHTPRRRKPGIAT